MGFRIATNIQSLSAQRTLGMNREAQNRTQDHLSSGDRILRAADDAAGLSISEKMKAAIRSLGQAERNAQDGVSLVQTAEGGLIEIQNILVRLRELSIQAASDTIGDVERQFMNKEVEGLIVETTRIAHSTRFNQTHLLNGSGEKLEVQVGIENSPENDRLVYDSKALDVRAEKLGLAGMTVSTKERAQSNLDVLDQAITDLTGKRAALGAAQNRFASALSNLMVYRENISAANSRIRDTDFASETSESVKRSILLQSGTAMLAQANSEPVAALKLLG